MKYAIRILFALLPVLGAIAPAVAGEGGVDKVVVYADRAEVTRVQRVDCAGGETDAVFERLPTTVDVRTLRAEASGRAEAIGTSSRVVALEENRDARVAELRDELQKLDDRIRTHNEKLQGIREREGGLNAYASYAQTLLGEQARDAAPDTGAWAALFDTLRDQRLRAAEQKHALSLKLRELSRQRELIARNLAALNPDDREEGLRVQVAVACRGEQRPRVSLSYVVPGATWHPEYDLRFMPRGRAKVGRGRAELTVAAAVQQATGEDWNDVRLVLSTAKPKLGAESPLPARITVRGHEAGEQKVLVESRERREKLAGPADQRQAGPASAALEDRGQSFVLTLPRRVSVHSDGRPYWMPVDVAETRAEAKLVTVPKLKPFVYQVVQLKNPAAYPLLAGRMHVYRKGSYIGDTRTEYKAPGEPMEVSLGIDEELKVERKRIRARDREAGVLSSTQHLERSWWIEVSNRAERRQRVEVRENIPVSKVEDVEVEIDDEKTSRGYEHDEHRGFLTWQLVIPRGGEKSIELHYAIHLPEDWKVNIRR
jgi:uncharacterized protein (TIGR02231 family)